MIFCIVSFVWAKGSIARRIARGETPRDADEGSEGITPVK